MTKHSEDRWGSELVWLRWFCARVSPNQAGCWVWTGGTNSNGHPRVRVMGAKIRVHRLIYELYIGPIPEDHDIHHTCRIKACVNPEHLVVMGHGEHSRLHNLKEVV